MAEKMLRIKSSTADEELEDLVSMPERTENCRDTGETNRSPV